MKAIDERTGPPKAYIYAHWTITSLGRLRSFVDLSKTVPSSPNHAINSS